MNIQCKKVEAGLTDPPSKSKRLDRVMRQYVAGKMRVCDISKRAGITAGALTARVKRLGLPLRGRGRKPLEKPSALHKRIIAAAAAQSYEQVGVRFGISKQRVSKIVQRWNNSMRRGVPKAQDKRKLYVISFRVDDKMLKRLRTELQNHYFRNLRSPSDVARELLTILLTANRVL
jgi:hypothetical protein